MYVRYHPQMPRQRFRPGALRIVTAGLVSDIFVWNANGQLEIALPARASFPVGVVISADGSTLAHTRAHEALGAFEGVVATAQSPV